MKREFLPKKSIKKRKVYQDNIMYNTFYNYNNKENILSKKSLNSSSIKFKINFSTGQEYEISGNANDTFQSTLNNFLKKNNLFNIQNEIKTAVFDGKAIKFDKTLSDNGINDGSKILLMLNPEFNFNRTERKMGRSISTIDTISNKTLEMNEEMLFFIIGFRKKINNKANASLNNIYKSSTLKKNICLGNKIECRNHVHISKHDHGLVLLYSNRDWTCKICYKHFTKNDSKYYCSICKFNVCNNCIGDNKKYPLTPFYHQQTKLKSHKFSCHEHKMIYCRTSRGDHDITNWICNICRISYGDKIWSFYCTNCDYDICLSCSKKYIPDYEFINKKGIKIDEHNDDLVYMITNRNWKCKLCRKDFEKNTASYYCTYCDYDVCSECMSKLSDEKNIHLLLLEREKVEHSNLYQIPDIIIL